MDKNKFKYLTDHPEALSYAEIPILEELVKQYPYFQLARVLHLRALKNVKNLKFNAYLTQTAVYTIQREALFCFIEEKKLILGNDFDSESENIIVDTNTSKTTPKTTKELHEDTSIAKPTSKEEDEADKEQVYDFETLKSDNYNNIKAEDKTSGPLTEHPNIKKSKKKKKRKKKYFDLNKSIENRTQNKNPKDLNQVTLDKKYSFTEWLKLSNNTHSKKDSKQRKSINRRNKVWHPTMDSPRKSKKKEKRNKNKNDLNRKIEIINKFLEQNPRIVPEARTENKNLDINRPLEIKSSFEKQELMTETLARVYIEQKKYEQAIESFKILQLKNPQKNSYFASEIEKINQLKSEKK